MRRLLWKLTGHRFTVEELQEIILIRFHGFSWRN